MFFFHDKEISYDYLQNLQLLTQYIIRCEMPGKDPDEMIDYEVSLVDFSKNEVYLQQKPYIQYIMICFGIMYE